VNGTATSHVGGTRGTSGRFARALQAIARAWNSLNWRHWLIAAGIGVLFGALNATVIFLAYFPQWTEAQRTPVYLEMLTRWGVLMTGLACTLAFALALLRDLSRRAAIRPRDVVLTIFVVAAFGSLVVDPISVAANVTIHTLQRNTAQHFLEGVDWLTGLSRLYAQTGEKILTFVATVTLSAVYYLKDSRTSNALASAQLGLTQAQNRRLTEELRSAQAAIDPDFLFATLAEVDRHFESEPRVAERLLEALIRYLRAALPANDDSIGTLGQQATLARAYMEIEGIRSTGRVQAEIDVPSELETRPFAPALLLPLVTLVAGDAPGWGRDVRIRVSASVASGRLSVEVRGVGCDRRIAADSEATLAPLRRRIGALYGSRAELSLATREPGESTANIVIDDPGNV